MNLLRYRRENQEESIVGLIVKRPNGHIKYEVVSEGFKRSQEAWKVMIKRLDKKGEPYSCAMSQLEVVIEANVIVVNISPTCSENLRDFLSIKKQPIKREISFYYSWKKHEAHLVRDTWICGKKQPTQRVSVKKSKKDKVDLEYAFMYAYLMLKLNLTTSELKRTINKYPIPYGQREVYTVKAILHEICIKECPKGFDRLMRKRIANVRNKDPKVT